MYCSCYSNTGVLHYPSPNPIHINNTLWTSWRIKHKITQNIKVKESPQSQAESCASFPWLQFQHDACVNCQQSIASWNNDKKKGQPCAHNSYLRRVRGRVWQLWVNKINKKMFLPRVLVSSLSPFASAESNDHGIVNLDIFQNIKKSINMYSLHFFLLVSCHRLVHSKFKNGLAGDK
jgi:hypothetical protein